MTMMPCTMPATARVSPTIRALCAAMLLVALAACDRAPAPASETAPVTATPPAAPAEPPPAEPAADSRLALSATGPHWFGYGQLRWGMSPEEMQSAFQPGTLSRPAGVGTDDTCHYLIPGDAAKDVRLMVEENRFVRAEFLTPATTAPGGGQVGWSAAQVRAAYGDAIEEQPHKYEDGALYLRIRAPEGDAVLLFETDAGGTVTRWRMGVAPQVDYVEGCA